MKRGLMAPDNLELEWMGADHPDTLAKLRAMEVRAFEASGRIAELRREVSYGAAAKGAKEKIVSRLKEKDTTSVARVTAEAKAVTRASRKKH